MRIVIDIDGTLCPLKKSHESYADLPVLPGGLKTLKAYKAAGHYIILQTARRMKTHTSNQGKVMADIGWETLEWLRKNQIPYDEIFFAKPYADLYIDDLGHAFSGWDDSSLQLSNEVQCLILNMTKKQIKATDNDTPNSWPYTTINLDSLQEFQKKVAKNYQPFFIGDSKSLNAYKSSSVANYEACDGLIFEASHNSTSILEYDQDSYLTTVQLDTILFSTSELRHSYFYARSNEFLKAYQLSITNQPTTESDILKTFLRLILQGKRIKVIHI